MVTLYMNYIEQRNIQLVCQLRCGPLMPQSCQHRRSSVFFVSQTHRSVPRQLWTQRDHRVTLGPQVARARMRKNVCEGQEKPPVGGREERS